MLSVSSVSIVSRGFANPCDPWFIESAAGKLGAFGVIDGAGCEGSECMLSSSGSVWFEAVVDPAVAHP